MSAIVLILALVFQPVTLALAAEGAADVPAATHHAVAGKPMMHASHLPAAEPPQAGHAIDAACILFCVTLATLPAHSPLFAVVRISFPAVEGPKPRLVANPQRFRPPIPSV